MTPLFWKNKTVLITGHSGFKGGWLSLWLQQLGAQVIGYALPAPTDPSLFEIAKVASGMRSIMGDVGDFAHLRAVVAQHQPDIVIHMAAQSLVRYSYENPLETYATNVMGTVHVLEAVRQTGGVRVVLNVTSDKCYDNQEWLWGYRESDALGGHDPYSSSKACAELVSAAYRDSYFSAKNFSDHGVALATVRAGNVIGGGDWSHDRLLADVMRALLEQRCVTLRNPHATRPWQHVLAPLHGYMTLAERLWEEGPAFAEAWNFGPSCEDTRSVAWLADRLTEQWGGVARCDHDATAQPHEAQNLTLDSAKARTRLGWTPALSLLPALKWIVEWYRAYQRHDDMRALSLAQISRYQAQVGI